MKGATQKRLRNLHNWFGVFFAPGLIFFALSGLLQTIGLHESGPSRQPAAAWIGLLASVHKEGEAAMPKAPSPNQHNPRATAVPSPEHGHGDGDGDDHDHGGGFAPFKVYVLLLSVSLIASTLTGIAVALANSAARRRTWTLLIAGCVVPMLLLVI
jgi:hypothetical protein